MASQGHLRCRLGVHRWTTVSAGDGQRLRRCRSCGCEQGPFPWPDEPGIRLDPRDVPPGGS